MNDDDLDPRDRALRDLLRRAARDEAPPAAVRARAVALAARAPDARAASQAAQRAGDVTQQAARLLRRIVAVALLPGGAPAPFAPALGVRGSTARGQQWLYRAADCEIDLRATPGDDERWSIAGQLFGDLSAQRIVLDGPGGSRSANLGPTREFGFAGLPAGSYSLAVQAGDVEVVVPKIELGATS